MLFRSLIVRLINFSTVRRTVTVSAGSVARADVTMLVATSADIVVTAPRTFRNLAEVENPAENLVIGDKQPYGNPPVWSSSLWWPNSCMDLQASASKAFEGVEPKRHIGTCVISPAGTWNAVNLKSSSCGMKIRGNCTWRSMSPTSPSW